MSWDLKIFLSNDKIQSWCTQWEKERVATMKSLSSEQNIHTYVQSCCKYLTWPDWCQAHDSLTNEQNCALCQESHNFKLIDLKHINIFLFLSTSSNYIFVYLKTKVSLLKIALFVYDASIYVDSTPTQLLYIIYFL